MLRSLYEPAVMDVFRQASQPRQKTVKVDGEDRVVPVPFPSPADWRDTWIYFLLVDRFNNPSAPPRSGWSKPDDPPAEGFQGGTFKGIQQQLPYLQEMGVRAIWLSPVQKNLPMEGSYPAYAVQDFLAIEPRFASDGKAETAEKELQELIDEAHARGMYIILDIILNHVGNVFLYEPGPSTATSDKRPWRADSPYPIYWRDATGAGRADWTSVPANPGSDEAVWPVELQQDEYFRRQGMMGPDPRKGDFESYKELRTEATGSMGRYPVRDALIRVYQYMIARFDFDGYRIDTLKHIEPDFARVFGNAIREYALSIGKRDFFTFGEVADSEEVVAQFVGREVCGTGDIIGIEAALDFPLAAKLEAYLKKFDGVGPQVITSVFTRRKEIQRTILTTHGEASQHFVTFLDSHDRKGRRYRPADTVYEHQVAMGLASLFCLQGIPCIYYGTEQALVGSSRQDTDATVREPLWGMGPAAFDRNSPAYQILKYLSWLRIAEPALRYGRQYMRPVSGREVLDFGVSWVAGGVLAFSRILNNREVVVLIHPGQDATRRVPLYVLVDAALNPKDRPYKLLYSNVHGPCLPGNAVQLPASQVRIEGKPVEGSGPIHAVPVELQAMEVQVIAGE